MTGTEIISMFELQVDDVTELSSVAELSVLNRVYFRICGTRPWEFLKTNTTGSIVANGTLGEITLPSNFANFYENYQYTNNTYSSEIGQSPKVVYVGTSMEPYTIVNYSDRNQYKQNGNVCYLDLGNNKIIFPKVPQSLTYSMDYIKFPEKITTLTSPLFPERFQDIFAFGMAIQNDIMQLSPKAKSYAAENKILYDELLAEMALWNSNLVNN